MGKISAPQTLPTMAEEDETELGLTQSVAESQPLQASGIGVGDAIGRYIVVGTLGVGGMGVVHAAYDPELDRKLAIKLLRSFEAGDHHQHEVRTRLRREAQAIAKLSHPNVVAVYDVGLHGGQVFVAMEFVDGGTLGEWMHDREDGQPHPWRDVLARFMPAARGLAAAHAAGLVHRDFKPANVLLGKDERPRVADFGIARSITSSAADDELEAPAPANDRVRNDGLEATGALTRTGALIGTPAYMAPEQFSDAQVDARADQFAFCVALHEALYGQRPFEAETIHALILEVRGGRVREPPRASTVPTWLRKIVLRGLATDPNARWPDINALLQALEHRPRRFGRLVAASSLALALIASATAIVLDDGPPSPPAVCVGVEHAFADAWTAEAREALATNLAARTTPAAREVAVHVLPRLDAWAQEWRAGWIDACEATRVRGEQSEELLDRRMSCLQRQRQRTIAYVELLKHADDELARAALVGLDELGGPSRCADTNALMASVPAPPDAEQRARVEQLSARLDQVHAALAAGDWELAKAKLAPLDGPITREGWLPLSAEFRYLRGHLHRGTQELELGEVAYRQAFVDALQVGDEQLAARSRRDLAKLIAEWESRHDEALEHLRVAEALALHLGDDALIGSVALAQATTLELRGDFEDALVAARRGAAAIREAHGPSSAMLAEAHYSESMSLYRLGRIDQAQAALDQARAGFGDDYGPTHPIALKMINAAGVLAIGANDWDLAETQFAELLTRQAAIFGPEHLDVSDALSNLGAAQYNNGKFEAALASHARALAIREREMGPTNLYVGHSLANLAVVYGRLEQHEPAEQAARRAFEIIEASRGERHHDTMIAHSLIAEVVQLGGDERGALTEFRAAQTLATEVGSAVQQLEYALQVALALVHLEHLEQATRELEQLQTLLSDDEVMPEQLLLYDYLRARIAAQTGDEAGAREHADRARSRLASLGELSIGSSEEAQAWLVEHAR